MLDIDPTTTQWIRNRSDQLAAEKGYFFHPPSADRVIQFAEVVCHTTPMPWQSDVIRRLYGWRKPDGTRRFTRGYISVAKKNGKTLLASLLSAYCLICEGGNVVSAANSRTQAGEVFSDMEKFIRKSPALRKRCKVVPSTKRILVNSTLANYHALSADVATGDGVRSKLAIYDEYHRATSSALYDVLQPAGIGQVEPLFVVITTSGSSLVSPCGDLYTYAKRVEAGNITDDAELGFFTAIYEADEKDDISLEATWHKANPALVEGGTMDLTQYRADYLEASQSPTRLATFRRLRLNQWVSADAEGAWLDQECWSKCFDPTVTLDMLKGRECWAGLDLSSTKDVTALVLIFKLDSGKYYLLPYFWLPAHDMQKRERRDGVPYWAWAQVPANNLMLTEGNVVDYNSLREKINELRTLYQIQSIRYDRWAAQMLVNELVGDGVTMAPFGQGFGSMSGPSKDFDMLVLSNSMHHGNNPLLNHMAAVTIVETDAAGNVKPSKRRSTQRIDGVVASVMALAGAIQAEPPLTESLVA